MNRLLIIMRSRQNKVASVIKKNDIYECEGVFALALIPFLKIYTCKFRKIKIILRNKNN